MTKFPREFLTAIPKSDIHVHLDGSVRLGTLIELAGEMKVKLPSYTESGLKEKVFKGHYKNLVEYLEGFKYIVAVMKTPEALERIAYEFALDNFAEGVRYVEPRFAPQRHADDRMSVDEVIRGVNDGLVRAKREINSKPEIRSGSEPPFEYGILCCAMRMFTEEYSRYFQRFVELHPYMPKDDFYGLASLDLVQIMVHVRDKLGVPIVGFDLAGAEKGHPAVDHKRAYDLAHKHFLKKTVHAGEAYGPTSIFQAITDCHADRIGHGTHLFDANLVDLPTKDERKNYVEALWQYIADSRITVEVCLTSNMQTMPKLKDLRSHPAAQMFDKRLSITFCTDNRLISNTTVTDEIDLAVTNFPISPRKLKDVVIYGFKHSFFAADYLTKRKYVRNIIDYYERMEKEFGIA